MTLTNQAEISGADPAATAHRSASRALFVILAATLACFMQAIRFPFVIDDPTAIVNNPYIKSWSYVPSYFSAALWNEGWRGIGGTAAFFRPVLFLWFRLNNAVFGLQTWGWHLTTIGLHLLATYLLFHIANRLLRDEVAAGFATLVFAINPARVESVDWVTGCADPLAAVFFLGALNCYLKYRDTGVVSLRWASLALILIAIFSKETALLFPVLVVVYELALGNCGTQFHTKREKFVAALIASLPFWAVDCIWALVRIAIFGRLGDSRSSVSLTSTLLTWPVTLIFYLRHLLWPFNLHPYYETNYVTTVSAANFWLPLLAIVAVIAVVGFLIWRSNSGVAFFAFTWLAITLIPALNFRALQWRDIEHDRYLYLPSMGFALLLGLVFRWARNQELFGRLANLAAPALVVIFGLNAVAYGMIWGNALTLYAEAAKAAPNHIAPVKFLADELSARGYAQEALLMHQRAVSLAPNWADAHLGLAKQYVALGRYAEAEVEYRKAAELENRSNRR